MSEMLPDADAIRALLKKRGWMQRDLARAMGCSDPNISRMLRYSRTCTLETMQRVAKVLGVKVRDIIIDKEEYDAIAESTRD